MMMLKTEVFIFLALTLAFIDGTVKKFPADQTIYDYAITDPSTPVINSIKSMFENKIKDHSHIGRVKNSTANISTPKKQENDSLSFTNFGRYSNYSLSNLDKSNFIEVNSRNYRSFPFVYSDHESLENALKSALVSNSTYKISDRFKRQSVYTTMEELDKIKIKSIEKTRLAFPHQLLKRKNLKIENRGEKVSICSETENGGGVEIMILDESLNSHKYLVTGNEPCHILLSDWKNITLLNVMKEDTLIVSNLLQAFERSQKIQFPGRRIVDITSWELMGRSFILIKTALGGSKTNMSFILYQKNDQFQFIQEFKGSTTGKPQQFQIGPDSFLVLPNFDTETEVFKFSYYQNKYVPFQKLGTNKATSVSVLSIKNKIYVFVSKFCEEKREICDPKANSVLFQYNGGEFEPFQIIPTTAVIQSSVVEHKGAVWLITLSSLKGVSVYHVNDLGAKEIFPKLNHQLHSRGLSDLIQFKIGSESYLGVKTILGVDPSWMLFKINFEEVNGRMKYEAVKNWCHEALKLLHEKFEDVEKRIKIKYVEESKTEFKYKNFIDKVIGDDTLSNFNEKVNGLEYDLLLLKSRILNIQNKVNGAINIHESTDWPDNLSFSSIAILAAKIDGLFVKNIDDKKVPSVEELIPLNNKDKLFNLQTKSFSDIEFQDLTVENLNDQPLSSYVTLHGNYSIKSRITIKQLETPKIKVGGLIDGIKVKENSILLNSGYSNFNGSLTCRSISATNLETDYINNVNIRKLMSSAFVEKSSINIKGNVVIHGDLIYPGDLYVGSILEKATKYFTRPILYPNSGKSQKILGHYHIKTMKVKELQVGKRLNKLPFPQSIYINLPIKVYHISKARFENLSAKKVWVDRNLNGLKVFDGELDVITLKGDQVVTGRKSFGGIHLKNYIVIKNQTSREFEKLPEFRMDASLHKELAFYRTSIKSKETLKLENLMLNNIFTIRTKLMRLIDTKPILLKVSLIASGEDYRLITQVITKLDAEVIKLRRDLETKNLDINLLDFSQNEIVQLGRLSTFKTLPRHLLTITSEFYGKLEKAYEEVQRLIYEKKKIISTLEENINIFEKRIRKEVERYNTRSIGYKGSYVRGLINDYDFSKISQTKKENTLISEYEILNRVKNADCVVFTKGLITPSINTVNLQKLLEKSVPFSFKDRNLNLRFEDTVVVQKNVQTSYINGKMASKFAKTNEINIFVKEVEFEDVRFFTDVEVKGNVNNLKLEDTSKRIARKDLYQKFTVPISFNLVDVGRMNISRIYINNIPMEEYTLSNENIIITGKKKFGNVSTLNSLVRIENLHTEELDKINLRTILENRRKVEKDFTLDKEIKLNELSVKGNLYILRYIRSFSEGLLNITSLFEESVQKNQSETVSGSLILEGNIKAKELHFNTTFDGILREALYDFVLQLEDQYLKETNVFKNVRVKNLIIKNNILQGVNLHNLFSDSVKVDENCIFSEKVSIDNITSRKCKVSGFVQGRDLTKEAVLNTSPSVISGIKIFKYNVTTSSDVQVNGLVNGLNFGQVCKDIAGEVEINGLTYFENDITIDHVQIGKCTFPNNYTMYWTSDSDIKIKNYVVFNETESKRIFISEKLNAEPIINIIEGPIPSNCKKEIEISELTVQALSTKNIEAKIILTENLDNEDGQILRQIILNSFHQTFENLTANDISVTGETTTMNFINEHKTSDFCLRKHACEIRASKTFYYDVNVLRNWDTDDDSLVNNIKIQQLKMPEVLSTQTVVVKGSIIVPSIRVNELVQGVIFNENTVMTLSSPQTMNGSLSISNKYRLAFEANEATILSKSINGMDISALELQEKIYEDISDITSFENMVEKYQNLTKNTFEINSLLKGQPVKFNGWEVTAKFDGIEKLVPLEQRKKSSIFLLALLSSKGIHLKNFIPHSKRFKDYVYMKVNCTKDAVGLYIKDNLFICTSVSCPNPATKLDKAIRVSPDQVSVKESVFSYLWKVTPTIPVLHAAIATSEVEQILSFKIANRNCLLFLSTLKDEQNILCEDGNSLILQQTLIIKRAIKATHLTYLSKSQRQVSLLVIGSAEASNELSVIRIMQLSHKSFHYETIQEIVANRLAWLSSSRINGIQYLASVHKPFIGSVEGYINIYRLEETSVSGDNGRDMGFDLRFDLQESIYLDDPLQATFLDSLSNEIFLLVLNKNEFIMRYVKRGYGKFQFGGSMHIPGAKTISSWTWEKVSFNLAVSVEEICSNGYSNSSKIYVFSPTYSGWQGKFDMLSQK